MHLSHMMNHTIQLHRRKPDKLDKEKELSGLDTRTKLLETGDWVPGTDQRTLAMARASVGMLDSVSAATFMRDESTM